MRAAITNQCTGYQLRTLLLGVIRGTPMATALGVDLEALIRDTARDFEERFDAGEALASVSEYKINWPPLVDELCSETDEDSRALAVALMSEVGIEKFSEKSIAKAALAKVYFPKVNRPKTQNVMRGDLFRNEKGKRTPKEHERESSVRYKMAQAFRAGIEGSISFLKRALRFFRCFNKGWEHYEATVGATIVAHNLIILARA